MKLRFKNINNQIWKDRTYRFFQLFFLCVFVTLCACSESFSERCKREALEYTQRQCPHNVTFYLIEDSMVYVENPAGFYYYNTLTQDADTTAFFDEANMNTIQEEFLKAIRSSIAMKPYKDHSMVFTFIFNSPTTKKERMRFTYTPEDYQ